MYRYLAYFLDASSSLVYDMISPRKLDDLAVSYELFNEEDAVEDILGRITQAKPVDLASIDMKTPK